MLMFGLKKAYYRLLEQHLMVSNIDHTSNAVWEKSADGGKQSPGTNVNWVVCLWLFLGCDGVAYTHICC